MNQNKDELAYVRYLTEFLTGVSAPILLYPGSIATSFFSITSSLVPVHDLTVSVLCGFVPYRDHHDDDPLICSNRESARSIFLADQGVAQIHA